MATPVSFWKFVRLARLRTKLWLGFLTVLAVSIAGAGTITAWKILQVHLAAVRARALTSELATRRELASREEKEGEGEEGEAEAAAPPFSLAYELKKIAISLSNRKGNQISYAQFTLVFDCPSEDSHRILELSRAAVRSRVYETAATFNSEDFHSEAGFARFKAVLMEQLKEEFGELAPRAIALHDWLLH